MFVEGSAIAEEMSCDLTVDTDTQDALTKDSTGSFSAETAVAKSWQASAKTKLGDAASLIQFIYESTLDSPTAVQICKAGGTNNSTIESSIFNVGGQALLTDLSMTFNDREDVEVSLQYQGTGALS